MRVHATELAAFASGGSAFLVLLLYAPALDAPFLVPKFAALEVTASLGFLAGLGAGDFVGIDHQGTGFALAHMRAKVEGLLERHPDS